MTARQAGRRALGLRRQLGERDMAVLSSLEEIRLLTTSHVTRLHFTDGPEASNIRRAQYTLKRLHNLKLVTRLSRVIGGKRAGSAGVVYGLSGLGLRVLFAPERTTQPRRRVWDTKPYFQDHMLAVANLYVGLKERGRQQVELLDFQGEPRCWRRFTGPGGDLIVVKPDAYVQIGVGTLVCSWFVEVDLGTETLPTIRRKCERYVAYWNSGVEQQRTTTNGQDGVFPFVLWLVPDTSRQEKVEATTRSIAAEAHTLFKVALLTEGVEVLTRLPGDSQVSDDETPGGASSRAPP
jgi:hypothetical protein